MKIYKITEASEYLTKGGFHSDASLSYEVKVDKTGPYFYGNLSFRDCGNSIHLELDGHNDQAPT